MNHEQQIEDGARAIAPDDWKLADAPSFAHLPSAAREGLISKSSKQARAAWAAFHPTITSEDELDALPQWSAIIDHEGDVGQRLGEFWHFPETAPMGSARVIKHGPATVLHYGDTE